MHAIIFTCLKSSLNFFFFIHLIFNPQNMSSPNTSLHIRCYCPSSVRCQFSWLLSLLPPLPHTVHCLHSRQDQPFKCRPVYAASLRRTVCWFAVLVQIVKILAFCPRSPYNVYHFLHFLCLSLPLVLLLLFGTLAPLPFLNTTTHPFLQAFVLALLSAELQYPFPKHPHVWFLIFLDHCSKFTLSERPFLTTSRFITFYTSYFILSQWTSYVFT